MKLKCTKFDFGWGSAPDLTGRAYSVLSDSLAGYKGPTSKGRGREGKKWPKGRGRKGERQGKEMGKRRVEVEGKWST